MRYDRDGDQHYDVTSAFIKSIRGSDVDAALHYLARMLEAGEDPRFIARRLVIPASEDIGMADPTALPTAVAAAAGGRSSSACPRAHSRWRRPPSTWPRRRSPTRSSRRSARRSPTCAPGSPGRCRRTCATPTTPGAKKLGHGKAYHYPHAHPDGVVPQQYPPDALVGKDYYRPTGRGAEARIGERLAKLRAIVRRTALTCVPTAPGRRARPRLRVRVAGRAGEREPEADDGQAHTNGEEQGGSVSAGEIAGLIAAGALVLLVVLIAFPLLKLGGRSTRRP